MSVFSSSYEVEKTDRGPDMPVAIFKKPVEVDGRLAQLGVTRDQLLEVVQAMIAARAACTDNDPPSAPGWSSWRSGTRRLREVLRSDIWLKDDSEQISCIVNHEAGMRIAVANTDDASGIDNEDAVPQNRSKKGAATDRAVDGTQQSLFGPTPQRRDDNVVLFVPRRRHSLSYVTFYVCVFNEGDIVRAEFSCPIVVENGYFRDFSERKILVGPNEWPPTPRRKNQDPESGNASEFDIPVRRK
jgi:hypothetical protein